MTCVSVCHHTCLHAHTRVCVYEWVWHSCVCMCIHPKGYFNFFRILNKQQQPQRSAAASGFWVGWVMVAGGEGWRVEGRRGLWLWLRGGEVAHGQGPRRTHWRLALEDFWTTTLLHQNAANPGSLLTHFQPKSLTSLSAFFFSVSLSLTVSPNSILSPWHIFLLKFPGSVDPNPDSFAIWPSSHFSLTAMLLVASLSCCVFSTFFSSGFLVSTHYSPLPFLHWLFQIISCT